MFVSLLDYVTNTDNDPVGDLTLSGIHPGLLDDPSDTLRLISIDGYIIILGSSRHIIILSIGSIFPLCTDVFVHLYFSFFWLV